MTSNKTILNYIDTIGMIDAVSDYNEPVKCFANGYRASILDKEDGLYSCAYCDYNGYFSWNHPSTNEVGKDNGAHLCSTENEVCEFIKAVSELPSIM